MHVLRVRRLLEKSLHLLEVYTHCVLPVRCCAKTTHFISHAARARAGLDASECSLDTLARSRQDSARSCAHPRRWMVRAMCCWLLLATQVSALRLSPLLVRRREALSLAALAPALPACAVAPPIGRSEGGVLWELELPASFSTTRRLASSVRSRVETMLSAEDAATGVQARLLLVPLGQQAAGSLSAEDPLLLASHFLSPDAGGGGDAQDVANVMAASAARSRSVISVARVGEARERKGKDGYPGPDA